MIMKHLLTTCFIALIIQMTLMDRIKSINFGILELSGAVVTKNFLVRNNTVSASSNTLILNSTIDHATATKGFDDSILTHG